ncbi:hypothetical protein JHK84_036983 [Glycine max]|nr:hypothetical protein JHK86_036756 [Glycine max]KAG5130586.1 hypothetical protein JHK84_036983 [Glycine max]
MLSFSDPVGGFNQEVVANMKGTPNLNFVGGDRFNSISSADAVLLKWILHDWNEELSLKILNNYKEAISSKGKRGKVIIIDIAIDEAGDGRKITELKLDFELVMLTMFNGKEREKERMREYYIRRWLQYLQDYACV